MAAHALRPNHSLTLLKGGEALFPALVEAIDAAQTEVLLETYIFDFARSVLPVALALERAAARGVTVCVVVDGVGTGEVPADWQQRWRSAGVRWRIFNPAQGWRLLFPTALAAPAPQAVRGRCAGRVLRRHQHARRLLRPESR